MKFETLRRRTVAVVQVPKGSEPVYYSRGVPYVRHGTESLPAVPSEVNVLVRSHFERKEASKKLI